MQVVRTDRCSNGLAHGTCLPCEVSVVLLVVSVRQRTATDSCSLVPSTVTGAAGLLVAGGTGHGVALVAASCRHDRRTWLTCGAIAFSKPGLYVPRKTSIRGLKLSWH